MAKYPCNNVGGKLDDEHCIGQITVDGTVKNVYEKYYTGTVTVTSTSQNVIFDTDTTKKYVDISGTVRLPANNTVPLTPWGDQGGARRYGALTNPNGELIFTYFDTNASNQGLARYFVKAQYYY